VKIRIKNLKAKKTKRTRVEESWNVKADKAKAIRKDLKRPKTEIEKEIKIRQAKIEKLPALKVSILKFSFHLHFAAAFIIFILFFNSISSVTNSPFSCPFQSSFHVPFSKIYTSRFQGLREAFFSTN
jgi:hypothetical protein